MADPENQPEQPKAAPEKQIIGKMCEIIIFWFIFLLQILVLDRALASRAGVVGDAPEV